MGILTWAMTVTVTRGDTVNLPCEVKSKGHIQRIWSRPDTSSKEQLFIGETRVSPNTRISVAGDLLIIDSLGEEEAGQYECKLAVNQGQDKQVTHTVYVSDSAGGTSNAIIGNTSSSSTSSNIVIFSTFLLLISHIQSL